MIYTFADFLRQVGFTPRGFRSYILDRSKTFSEFAADPECNVYDHGARADVEDVEGWWRLVEHWRAKDPRALTES